MRIGTSKPAYPKRKKCPFLRLFLRFCLFPPDAVQLNSVWTTFELTPLDSVLAVLLPPPSQNRFLAFLVPLYHLAILFNQKEKKNAGD